MPYMWHIKYHKDELKVTLIVIHSVQQEKIAQLNIKKYFSCSQNFYVYINMYIV